MPLDVAQFEKLYKRKVHVMHCLCGAKLIVGFKANTVRCWKCKKLWKIVNPSTAMLIGFMRNKQCKFLPNWMTNQYGQCGRKAICLAQGRKCNAIEKVIVQIEAV